MNFLQEKILIPIGNFFFRWRDTAFSIIFVVAFYIVRFPELGVGDMRFEIAITAIGFLVAMLGQAIRMMTIGYAYIKRGGLNKRIYADKLVVQGLFNHTRNPLYVGNILIMIGGILVINMNWYYAIALPLFYIIYIGITLAEEKFLKQKFGQDYLDYMKRVNRFWPHRFSEWTKSVEGMDFTWKRTFKKEHNTTFIIFVALLAFTILKFYYRYGIQFTDPAAMIGWCLIGALVVFQITIVILKRTGRLEWDPDRP